MSPYQKDQVLMNFRLAYRKTGYVNWCEALGTVLANDEVKDGVSERGGHPVEEGHDAMVLRITAYAHRLLDDMMGLDWPEALKTMQNNWIGCSEGAQLFLKLMVSIQNLKSLLPDPIPSLGLHLWYWRQNTIWLGQLTTPEQNKP